MKICVIGTGYVGLVTGTCFAESGNEVTCVDIDEKKVKNLHNGIIPIYEPGLEELVKSNIAEDRLFFTTDLASALNQSDVCFIAVGTPPQEDGSADLSHVIAVAQQIAAMATKAVVVGTKSTVPVGTGDQIEEVFRKNLKHPYTVFSNPEFLKEGDAVNDFLKPDRVVIGLNDTKVVGLLKELYAPFTRQRDRLIIMNRRSAELTKYAANAMLATRISFMNEIANLCEKVGADVNDVRNGIGSDPRIGPAFLFPGMGYGGSCFPKDVKALSKTAHDFGSPLKMVEACEEANQHQKTILAQKIRTHFGNKTKGLKAAVWGLAFKARTDDIRESSAMYLVEELIAMGTDVTAFDPQAMPHAKSFFEDKIDFAKKPYECLPDADFLVIATEWNEFRSPDFDKMKSLMKQPIIFDGRNLLDRGHIKKSGFTYYGIGIS